MCSMAVAEGLPAAGLVLLSYPLHPPGKPEKLRTEHLPALGSRASSSPGPATRSAPRRRWRRRPPLIPGPVTHVWLEGARHDPKGLDAEIAGAVADWVATLG